MEPIRQRDVESSSGSAIDSRPTVLLCCVLFLLLSHIISSLLHIRRLLVVVAYFRRQVVLLLLRIDPTLGSHERPQVKQSLLARHHRHILFGLRTAKVQIPNSILVANAEY